MLIKSAILALGLGATLGAAVTSLEIQGNSFVNPKTGAKFQIVGVAYQPGGSAGYKPDQGKDPLSDADNCLRDAALMQVLGVNTIRVYNLDPNLNHDACASIFNAAGMYMILDVNSPLVGESLVTDQPWTSYYAAYLNRTFAVVEAFSNYPNTLAFFSGNEVISSVESAKYVPPYLRAVTRDLKSYIKQHITRQIPVGYSAADVREVLVDTYNYLICDDNGDGSNADLFALNSYSWCGESDIHTSTYDQLIADFQNSPVPVFFSEYGCNNPAPRIFTEVGALYGDQMTPVMSGGIVYEYAQEANDYGLVNINDDGTAQLLKDYHTLAAQYLSLNFTKVEGGKPASSTPSTPKCDPSLITEQGFNNNFTIPATPTSDDSAKILAAGVNPKPSGKLIDISDWTVKLQVTDVDGSNVQNLAVKQLASDQSNQPGLNTAVSVTATATGTAATPSATKKGAAAGLARPALAALALPLVALFFV